MTDRYNPFGLPYLDNPVDTPNYSVDSRWPDQPWAEKPSLKTKNAFERSDN